MTFVTGSQDTTVEQFIQEAGLLNGVNKDKQIALLNTYANKDGNSIFSKQEQLEWLNSSEYEQMLNEYKTKDAERIQQERQNGTYERGLSKEQLTSIFNDKEYMAHAQEGLSYSDANGDGKVTLQEFVSDITKRWSDYPKELLNKIVNTAQNADTDADGTINTKEYVAWLNGKEYGEALDDSRIIDAGILKVSETESTDGLANVLTSNILNFVSNIINNGASTPVTSNFNNVTNSSDDSEEIQSQISTVRSFASVYKNYKNAVEKGQQNDIKKYASELKSMAENGQLSGSANILYRMNASQIREDAK